MKKILLVLFIVLSSSLYAQWGNYKIIRNTINGYADTASIMTAIRALQTQAIDVSSYGDRYFPLSDGSEFKPANIDSVIRIHTDSVRPKYKVYTALLNHLMTQQTSGSLIVGHTYLINTVIAGDDFYNVGFVELGVPFNATGTTPTSWSNSTEVADLIVTAIELDNTIGDIVWDYTAVGTYAGTLANAFTSNKTILIPLNDKLTSDGYPASVKLYIGNESIIYVSTYSDQFTTPADGLLNNTPIEIRVYK